jgi:hypothetical protein
LRALDGVLRRATKRPPPGPDEFAEEVRRATALSSERADPMDTLLGECADRIHVVAMMLELMDESRDSAAAHRARQAAAAPLIPPDGAKSPIR